MISENSIVGFSNWDGTVSPDEFRKGSHLFSEKWKTVCRTHEHDLPPWSWVCCKNPLFFTSHEVSGYLSMEKMCVLSSDKIDEQEADQTVEEPDCFESEDHADPALLVQQTSQEAHYYDFHIVYSSSYRIPVLYFRGYRSDGQPLMLDQIERDLPPSSIQALAKSKWTFITQQEHPYLNRPYFTLHPCGTNELMRLLLSSTYLSEENVSLECYFVSWLSIVSQVVGLRIPLQLAAYSA